MSLPRMARDHAQDLDRHLENFQAKLPEWAARYVGWLRQPGSGWVRIPAGTVLVLGGFVGFLPILGFWMIPLGLLIMAIDIPFLRPSLVRMLNWIERKWASKGG